jgi:cell wall-associated NlpC family hydrolase
VAVARRFVDLPYIWGGRASDGVDCSGLVQMAAMACGFDCPRDSDMQEDRFGTALAGTDVSVLEHGDLVFWKGHVGLVTQDQAGQGEMLLHANGYHMAVVEEPLAPALERIRTRSFGGVTRLRRPPRSKNDAGAR